MPFITPFKEKPPDDSADGSARRIENGALENARTSVLHVLQDRFGEIPANVPKALEAIENPNRLTTLMRLVVRAKTVGEFLRELEK